MSILSRPSFARIPAPKPDDPKLIRASRIACARCGTINCVDHGPVSLTSRATVPAYRRGIISLSG